MKTALSLVIGLVLTGCAITQAPLLPLGASMAQVQGTVGPPKSKSKDGAITTWNYGEGMVCVFRNGQLIATNFNIPARPSSAIFGSILPSVAINVVPAPYYVAPVYAAPYYATPYYGGWGTPYYARGWNRPYWGGNRYPRNYNQRYWSGNRGYWNRW